MTVFGFVLAITGLTVSVFAGKANGLWLLGGLLILTGLVLMWGFRNSIPEDPNPEYSRLDRVDGRR